jgi:putative hemolysin
MLMDTAQAPGLFEMDMARLETLGPLRARLAALGRGALQRALALRKLEKMYARVRGGSSPGQFLEAGLRELGVRCACRPQDLANVPKHGPTLVVANHPFGALEGMILARHLLGVRPDVKIMANYLLGRVPELRELFIFVDPFEASRAVETNLGPLRAAMRWLAGGGLLVVFPAGEVSHMQISRRAVSDPAWNGTAAHLARKTGAQVVPVHFQGRNSLLFQTVGLVHPGLRTLMLPRELANKAGKTVVFRVGGAIAPGRLQGLGGLKQTTAYLRARTELLAMGQRPRKPREGLWRRLTRLELAASPIVAPQDREILRREVEDLPPEQTLLTTGDFRVFYAQRRQAPALLNEIGRLREVCFRQVGEGTGARTDLDRFDEHYLHLCLWSQAEDELAGGYRLGPVDRILASQGPRGLYTGTLFKFAPEFFARLEGALELGRSFIAPKHQRSYSALLLLWKGIGRFVMVNPRYRHLFGPVSLSERYHPFSRRLLVDFLRRRHHSDLAALVSPLTPPHLPADRGGLLRRTVDGARDFEEISEIIADIEGKGMGAPILFKQYLKLSAKWAGCNLDPCFGNALDCLLVADLTQADDKIMTRYCGKEGLAAYRAFHGAAAAPAVKRCA